MADNYKILAQDIAYSSVASDQPQANIVYTVPAGSQASLSSVSLTNSSDISVDYSIGIIKSEEQSTTNKDIGIAYTEDNFLFRSVDGQNWIRHEIPAHPYGYSHSAFGNGRFIIVQAQFTPAATLYSDDGITWTIGPNIEGPGVIASLSFANGRFIVGINTADQDPTTLRESADGTSWSTLGQVPIAIQELRYDEINGVMIAIPVTNLLYYSPFYSTDNGVTWQGGTIPNLSTSGFGTPTSRYGLLLNASGRSISGVRFTEGETIRHAILYTDNGINWSLHTQDIASDFNVTSFIFSRSEYPVGTFLANGWSQASGYSVLVSENGLDWTQSFIAATEVREAAYIDNVIAAIGFYSGSTGIWYSTDNGITWSDHQPFNSSYTNKMIVGRYLLNEILPYQTIIPTRSIEANAVDEIVGGIALSGNDSVVVSSESPDLIVQVYGVEIA